jgi:serine/threonine protein kinase
VQGSRRRVLTYWLLEEFGGDRLGRIFRAEDTRGGGFVIVRVLRVVDVVPLESAAVAREALRRRVRAAAAVVHPAFPPILDYGQDGEEDIVVYREVPGQTIRDRLLLAAETPARDALRHAIEVTGGVAAAHARGVLHRRLNADNILIGRDGCARVLDLGIPRPHEVAFDLAGAADSHDSEVAIRQDIHALARVVQILLTGVDEPGDVRNPAARRGVAGRAMRAIAKVMRSPAANAAMLHAALTHVARQTPSHVAEVVKGVPPTMPPASSETGRSTATAPAVAAGGRSEPATVTAARAPAPPPRPRLVLPPDSEHVDDDDVRADVLPPRAGLLVPPDRRGRWRKVRLGGPAGGRLLRLAPQVAGSALVGAVLVLGFMALPIRNGSGGGTGAEPVDAPPAADMTRPGDIVAEIEAMPAGTRIIRVSDGVELGRDRVQLGVAPGDSVVLLFLRTGFPPVRRVFRGEPLRVDLEAPPRAGA